jgi:hypothetical protein
VSESPESASGSPHPAANQPGHADPAVDPASGAPYTDNGKHPTPGSGASSERTSAGAGTPADGAAPTPGDSAGVTVNSDTSLLGSSETSTPIQSTGEMVTEEARERAAQAPDPDSAAPGDSALPPG